MTHTVSKENIQKALSKAVAAIYLDDSSDYSSALWVVVRELGGEEAIGLLERDAAEAFEKYAKP